MTDKALVYLTLTLTLALTLTLTLTLALTLALSYRYVARCEAAKVDTALDEVCAMSWRLSGR